MMILNDDYSHYTIECGVCGATEGVNIFTNYNSVGDEIGCETHCKQCIANLKKLRDRVEELEKFINDYISEE
jgi:hypothetical protein